MSKPVHQSSILVKPPQLFLDSQDLEKSSFANCTFTTVSELRALLNSQKTKHRATKSFNQEDYDQVEKLNHFRMNSAAGGRRFSKRFTARRKISVTYDPSKIMQLTTKEFPISNQGSLTLQEKLSTGRNKSKLLKDEYTRVTCKNKLIIESLQKEILFITNEVEKLKKSVRAIKEDIEQLVLAQSSEEAEYHSQMSVLQQQETTVLLYTKNVQGKKLFKSGDMHNSFVVRERIRQQKTELHASHQAEKDRLSAQLGEKRNEKESLVLSKRGWKKELNVLKSSLITVYLKILKQGLDLRDLGLRWVIKALWELKQPIPLSTFPGYIDEESAQFLLSMTMMDLELAEYHTRLDVTREKMKEERTATVVNRNISEMLSDVKTRIRQISRSAVAAPFKKFGENVVVENAATGTEGNNFANELTWIKENIERIVKVMDDLMEREAARVAKNFKLAPRDIGISHILKALLGDRSRDYMKFAQI